MYNTANGTWCNWIIPGSDGCVCFTIEFIEGVVDVDFSAVAGDSKVSLAWSTGAESDMSSYRVMRRAVGHEYEMIATVAAANSNNAAGVTGVDWLARLMPIKVLDADGYGNTSDIVDGVNWARTNGANVISMSLGGGGFSSSFNSAITTAYNAGVFVVAAAGNDNNNSLSYPALYTNCFSVGALSPCNQRKSPSSCDGETWWGSNYGTGLDIMAPGVKLRSAAVVSTYVNDMNGTSGATPHVAGVAALLKGADPSLTAAEIRDILRSSAVDMGTAGYDTQTGYGRLNAAAALALLVPPDPCDIDAVPPAIVHTPLEDTSNSSTPYAVVATVTDECSLLSVVLRRRFNGGSWTQTTMTHSGGGVYTGSIPAQSAGTLVTYEVVATDNSANNNSSTVQHSFSVVDPCLTDYSPPALSVSFDFVDTYSTSGPYGAIIEVSDPCGVTQVVGQFQVNGGTSQPATVNNLGGTTYSVTIPGQATGSHITWSVVAIDASPNFNLGNTGGQFDILDPCALDATAPQLAVDTPFADTQDTAGPYAATVSASDPCGITAVTGTFQVDGGGAQVLSVTNLGGGQYGLSIPGQATGSVISWSVSASDASPAQNSASAGGQFTILDPCDSDLTVPVLTVDVPFVDTEDNTGPYVSQVTAVDPCGIALVAGTYSVNGGESLVMAVTDLGGGLYSLSVPGQAGGSTIDWSLAATDGSAAGNTSALAGSFQVLNVIPTAAPVVTITHLGGGTSRLQWAAVPGAIDYTVYMAGTDGVFSPVLTTPLTQMDYAGTSWDLKVFRVTANN